MEVKKGSASVVILKMFSYDKNFCGEYEFNPFSTGMLSMTHSCARNLTCWYCLVLITLYSLGICIILFLTGSKAEDI